ncbi:MAG: ECF transporter S component [Armatimonadota bacterium]
MKDTRLSKIVKIGIFSAVAAVFMIFFQFVLLVHMPFLKYDPSDIPALIISFALGPFSGLAVVLVKDLLYMLLKPDIYNLIGVPMDFLASGSFVFIAGIVYHRRKTKKGAVTALLAAVFFMTVFMAVINYFIVPAYLKLFFPSFGVPAGKTLTKMIVAGIIPFNLLKGILNSLATFLIYKKMSKILR